MLLKQDWFSGIERRHFLVIDLSRPVKKVLSYSVIHSVQYAYFDVQGTFVRTIEGQKVTFASI
jgi:hypothetical protein